jgi:hypothetical protein
MAGLDAAAIIDGHHHETGDERDAGDGDFIRCRHAGGSIKRKALFFATLPRVGLFSSTKRTELSPETRGSTAAESVRRADLTAVPAGAGWQAVSVRGVEGAGLWPSYAVDFLAACSEFKPLAEHLGEYARYHSLEAGEATEMRHWAEKMAAAGLFVRADHVVARCAARSGVGEAVRIEAIGIPTAGNEARLRRVIATFARNAREHGRRPEFTISTNGPAEKIAGLVADIARGEGVRITVIGDAERLALGARLAERAGVDPMTAAFAVSDPLEAGFACGANRNALLLAHAGRPFLSIDDDVACELAAAPGGMREGLAVFASRDAFERWFFTEYGKAFEGRQGVDCDYLGLHERMLGHGVGPFFARERNPDFIGVSDDLLRRLQETDGRILVTFTGHFGHPGIPTSYYYLTYRRGTLARLTGQGERQYRAFLASGGVLALVPRMAVADCSLSPGMTMGIDSRLLLPPFPPVMHAEDFVWGAALWQCCATGFAGHLSVAVRHDPGIGRGLIVPPLEGLRPVAMWEFAHLLRGVLLTWAPPPGVLETAARMDSLGRYLCDIAEAPAGDFHEYIRAFVLQHESEKIAFMEQCVSEERDAADFWRRDVEDYIEQTRHALAEPDFDIPFDMREQWVASDARVMIQRFFLEYGRLLRAWPGLHEAASEISH